MNTSDRSRPTIRYQAGKRKNRVGSGLRMISSKPFYTILGQLCTFIRTYTKTHKTLGAESTMNDNDKSFKKIILFNRLLISLKIILNCEKKILLLTFVGLVSVLRF